MEEGNCRERERERERERREGCSYIDWGETVARRGWRRAREGERETLMMIWIEDEDEGRFDKHYRG